MVFDIEPDGFVLDPVRHICYEGLFLCRRAPERTSIHPRMKGKRRDKSEKAKHGGNIHLKETLLRLK